MRGTLMKKDVTDLPSDVQAQVRALEALPDDQIDTTDAPEIIDWLDARRGAFYRPVKQQITLRLDADIIAWFKARARGGRGYQTDINGALREHVQRAARFKKQG
ncbi:MAG: BrnA antitoxin family protein [Dehalococcoidia bacterium]|nr:BrnA antitoxin family protein [Dehalococcoidia bacterium]